MAGSTVPTACRQSAMSCSGRGITLALDRHHMHHHRPPYSPGPAQRLLHLKRVMAIDRPEIDEAEISEQIPARLHTATEPQHTQVLSHRASRGRVGAAVVIQHHNHRPVLGGTEIVQRLPRHPPGQRPVPDHRHHCTVLLTSQLTRLGQTIRVGKSRGGMRVLHHVVNRLRPRRIPRQATRLPQLREALAAACEQLVHIRLMTRIKDQRVARGVEHPVQRQRQLHHTQIRAQMPTRRTHLLDQEPADLPGKLRKLLRRKSAYVRGPGDVIKTHTPERRIGYSCHDSRVPSPKTPGRDMADNTPQPCHREMGRSTYG
ncbi:hypothetical protein ABIE67_000422 [Streptomyces sp. V4I8]